MARDGGVAADKERDWVSAYAETHLVPLSAVCELTYKCNSRCLHCYVVPDKTRGELAGAAWINLLDQLAAAGCLMLTYTGGEVLLRPDFWDLVAAAAERNFALQVFTNGTLLDKAGVKKLAELGVLAVGISLYGASPRSHERVSGLAGSFARSLHAVRLLREAGITVLLKHVVMKQNKGEYPAILDLAAAVGAVPQIDPLLVPANDGSPGPLTHRLARDDMAVLLSDERVTPRAAPYDAAPEFCTAGRSTCGINPYGDVFPCVQLLVSAGNIENRPFSLIWREGAIFRQLRKMKLSDISACPRCELLAHCHRCPGLALLEDKNLLGPSRIACRQAGIFSKLYQERKVRKGA